MSIVIPEAWPVQQVENEPVLMRNYFYVLGNSHLFSVPITLSYATQILQMNAVFDPLVWSIKFTATPLRLVKYPNARVVAPIVYTAQKVSTETIGNLRYIDLSFQETTHGLEKVLKTSPINGTATAIVWNYFDLEQRRYLQYRLPLTKLATMLQTELPAEGDSEEIKEIKLKISEAKEPFIKVMKLIDDQFLPKIDRSTRMLRHPENQDINKPLFTASNCAYCLYIMGLTLSFSLAIALNQSITRLTEAYGQAEQYYKTDDSMRRYVALIMMDLTLMGELLKHLINVNKYLVMPNPRAVPEFARSAVISNLDKVMLDMNLDNFEDDNDSEGIDLETAFKDAAINVESGNEVAADDSSEDNQ